MHRRSAHSLAAPALAVFVALGATGCRGGADNANNGNANRATVNANANYGSTANTAATSDTALRNTIQANLTKSNITGVEVEVEDGVVTLKGSVPRDKMQEAVKAANDAGPKRVLNQINAQ